MRVGVTGAHGYVGHAMVAAFAAYGHDVVALSRTALTSLPSRVTAQQGDVLAPATLERFAASVDAVVHCAAWVHRPAATAAARAECRAVNVGMTRTLIEALERAGGAKSLAFVSTSAVYGPAFHDADEARAPAPASTYAATKLEAEQLVLAAHARGAVRGMVLRPVVIYGPQAPGNTRHLLALVRRGLVPLIAGGLNRKSLVHVDDVCAAAILALENVSTSGGRAWNVAGDALTLRAMCESLAAGLGRKPGWLLLPETPLRAAAALSGALSRASGGTLPDLGRALEVFMDEATVDARTIVKALGARFRASDSGLEAMARAEAARA